jgi:flagella basal body P-ring formation protein FlgA
MMFDFRAIRNDFLKWCLTATSFFVLVTSVYAQQTAVVPESIIYPGQKISRAMVREVNVINPNLRPGYAKIISEVDGFVTKKTLLPGRIIPVSALREAYLIERGKKVALVFSNNKMVISAQGIALQNGGLGEVIKARNLDSGIIISGIIMQNGTLRAMPK